REVQRHGDRHLDENRQAPQVKRVDAVFCVQFHHCLLCFHLFFLCSGNSRLLLNFFHFWFYYLHLLAHHHLVLICTHHEWENSQADDKRDQDDCQTIVIAETVTEPMQQLIHRLYEC